MNNVAVVLVGHGSPPKDYPQERVAEYMRLKTRAELGDIQAKQLFDKMDKEIRNWAGLKELAEEVNRAGSFVHVEAAFNEFCGPTLEEAIERVAKLKPDTVIVVSTMTTRGSEHSEVEIKEKVESVRKRYPNFRIVYAWPYDLRKQADFFAQHVRRFLPT